MRVGEIPWLMQTWFSELVGGKLGLVPADLGETLVQMRSPGENIQRQITVAVVMAVGMPVASRSSTIHWVWWNATRCSTANSGSPRDRW